MLLKRHHDFRAVTAILLTLLVTTVLHKFVYSAFSLYQKGWIAWYSLEQWQQYWAWLPGKILCIANAALILLLIAVSIFAIFFKGRNGR